MAYADYVLHQKLHLIELQIESSNRGSTRISGVHLSKIAATRQPCDLGARARKSMSHLRSSYTWLRNLLSTYTSVQLCPKTWLSIYGALLGFACTKAG